MLSLHRYRPVRLLAVAGLASVFSMGATGMIASVDAAVPTIRSAAFVPPLPSVDAHGHPIKWASEGMTCIVGCTQRGGIQPDTNPTSGDCGEAFIGVSDLENGGGADFYYYLESTKGVFGYVNTNIRWENTEGAGGNLPDVNEGEGLGQTFYEKDFDNVRTGVGFLEATLSGFVEAGKTLCQIIPPSTESAIT